MAQAKQCEGTKGTLGLTGYYRKSILGYGSINGPLTKLLKKDSFIWSELAEKAFNSLKKAMTTGLVLALLDFNKPFVIECDASSTGIGVVLLQDSKPIAYFSLSIKGKKISRYRYEKEMMVLIAAVQKWWYMFEQTIVMGGKQKWRVKLMGYDFTIEYKKGRDNSAGHVFQSNPVVANSNTQ